MKDFIVDNLSEVSESMYFDITEDNYKDVMFAGYYEDAIMVLKHLLMFDDTIPYHINIANVDWDGYEKEYYVTLDSNMNVWCTRAYDHIYNRYLETETKCLYIADDCNSTLLKYIYCNKDEMYEVSYNLDDECDDNCKCCCSDTEKDSHEVVTRVATDENGKLKGFEKSWDTFEDGLHYHSIYSFFSSNEDMLKNMLENFDIKY